MPADCANVHAPTVVGRSRASCPGAAHAIPTAVELVSRAIRGDTLAWDAFVAQYSGLLLWHIRKQPSYAAVPEDAHFWVERAFQRFALAVGPARLETFTSEAALLQYLKMCAGSVLLDEARSRRRNQHTPMDALTEVVDPRCNVEESCVARLHVEAVWTTITHELSDELERLVARLSLKDGRTPADIHAEYADRFSSVNEVYRIKRNMIQRLRRSARLRELLSAN